MRDLRHSGGSGNALTFSMIDNIFVWEFVRDMTAKFLKRLNDTDALFALINICKNFSSEAKI